MSTVVASNNAVKAVRKKLLKNHTLEAVLSMPDDIFIPLALSLVSLFFKAHNPHPDNKETFFGYFKDDGFVKAKNKGRIDANSRWGEIKKQWLDAYVNQKIIAGLSVKQRITAEDEWCAEAYMETDYSNLTEEDFVKTIKDYVAFQFLQGDDK